MRIKPKFGHFWAFSHLAIHVEDVSDNNIVLSLLDEEELKWGVIDPGRTQMSCFFGMITKKRTTHLLFRPNYTVSFHQARVVALHFQKKNEKENGCVRECPDVFFRLDVKASMLRDTRACHGFRHSSRPEKWKCLDGPLGNLTPNWQATLPSSTSPRLPLCRIIWHWRRNVDLNGFNVTFIGRWCFPRRWCLQGKQTYDRFVLNDSLIIKFMVWKYFVVELELWNNLARRGVWFFAKVGCQFWFFWKLSVSFDYFESYQAVLIFSESW